MARINYEVLEFDHIVEFTNDHTVFAAARENGSGHTHTRLFLVNEATGNVYARNGQADSWEQLTDTDRGTVIAKIIAARNNNIPVYKINGTNGSI